MNIRIKSIRGVTLIEMMLVLIIMSLIAVSVMEYTNRKRDEAVAEKLGQKLYVYGQAVRSYLFDNQANIRGTPQKALPGGTLSGEKYTFTGVDWLKAATANPNPEPNSNPYLEDSFTFNTGLHPLFLGVEEGKADENITTTVEFKTAGDKTSPMVVTVTVPILHKMIKNVAVPQPGITVMGAEKANTFYDAASGGAAFTYNYTIPTDGVYTGTNIIGLLSSLAAQEDYLRVDGQNYMKQSIVLSEGETLDDAPFAAPTDSGARNIMGVERIYFDTSSSDAPTGITGIDVMLFDSPNSSTKTIQGLHTLEFSDSAFSSIASIDSIKFTGTGSTINALQRINFTDASSAAGAITNINKLVFDSTATAIPTISFPSNDGVITGLKTLNFASGGSITGLSSLIVGGTTINGFVVSGEIGTTQGETKTLGSTTDRFCYLTKVVVGDSTNVDKAMCQVEAVSGNWRLRQERGGACAARCFGW